MSEHRTSTIDVQILDSGSSEHRTSTLDVQILEGGSEYARASTIDVQILDGGSEHHRTSSVVVQILEALRPGEMFGTVRLSETYIQILERQANPTVHYTESYVQILSTRVVESSQTYLFGNFAASFAASPILVGASTVTVITGDGDLFPDPALSPNDVTVLVLEDGPNKEICHLLSKTGDILTIDRAKEGTTELQFPALAKVQARATAAPITRIDLGTY